MIPQAHESRFIHELRQEVAKLEQQNAPKAEILTAAFNRFSKLPESTEKERHFVIKLFKKLEKDQPSLSKAVQKMSASVLKADKVFQKVLPPLVPLKVAPLQSPHLVTAKLVDEILTWLRSNRSDASFVNQSKDGAKCELMDLNKGHWRLSEQNGNYRLLEVEKNGAYGQRKVELSQNQGVLISNEADDKPLRDSADLLGSHLGETVSFDASSLKGEPKINYKKGEIVLLKGKDGKASFGIVEAKIGKSLIVLTDDNYLKRTDSKKYYDAKVSYPLEAVIPLNQEKVSEWILEKEDQAVIKAGHDLGENLGKQVSSSVLKSLVSSQAGEFKKGDIVVVSDEKGNSFLAVYESIKDNIFTLIDKTAQLVSKNKRMLINRKFYEEHQIKKADPVKVAEYLEGKNKAPPLPKAPPPMQPPHLAKKPSPSKAASPPPLPKTPPPMQPPHLAKKPSPPKAPPPPLPNDPIIHKGGKPPKKKVMFKEENSVAEIGRLGIKKIDPQKMKD